MRMVGLIVVLGLALLVLRGTAARLPDLSPLPLPGAEWIEDEGGIYPTDPSLDIDPGARIGGWQTWFAGSVPITTGASSPFTTIEGAMPGGDGGGQITREGGLISGGRFRDPWQPPSGGLPA